jgi:hypothetical protein
MAALTITSKHERVLERLLESACHGHPSDQRRHPRGSARTPVAGVIQRDPANPDTWSIRND